MIVYFSGGSDIVEVSLPAPAIMLSAYCHADGEHGRWKPIGRFKELLRIRAKAKGKPIPEISKVTKKGVKCQKKKVSKSKSKSSCTR